MIDRKDINMTGHIIDKIYDKNGNLIKVIEGHNMIVNSFTRLVMALCKQEDGFGGIQYWAIGSGNPDWDDEMQDPNGGMTKLESEIGRIAINPSDIVFLSPADYSESQEPTNVIQIQHTFGVDDCNGEWREFGIFGGNATQDADSGIMINKRHHSVITKTDEMIVERTMRFTLNLS